MSLNQQKIYRMFQRLGPVAARRTLAAMPPRGKPLSYLVARAAISFYLDETYDL